MFLGWITTRRRLLSPGYGWLLRGVYGSIALIGLTVGWVLEPQLLRELGLALLILVALTAAAISALKLTGEPEKNAAWLDLAAGLAGFLAVVGSAAVSGSPVWLIILRFCVGALFMGALTDTMLLGHWYLVQPGLTRDPLKEQVSWSAFLWGAELLVWLIPTGMISVLSGSVDDEYGGLLGWFWAAGISTTAILIAASWAALREKGYPAVMATTGLAYLSILTGFVAHIMSRLALSA